MTNDLISRSKLIERYKEPCHSFLDVIESMPGIDAVPVIRCKDCTNWGRSPFGSGQVGWCKIQGHHRRPEYYCASAKKKVEG